MGMIWAAWVRTASRHAVSRHGRRQRSGCGAATDLEEDAQRLRQLQTDQAALNKRLRRRALEPARDVDHHRRS